MTELSFFVEGLPAPGGSKNFYPLRRRDGSLVMRGNRPIVRVADAGKGNARWKSAVAATAMLAMKGRKPAQGPLRLSLLFHLPRPKAHYGRGKNHAVLARTAPPFPIGRPDVLKLARAVEDAMTGTVYADDAQIVYETLEKVYGALAGVRVAVRQLAD